MHFDKFHQNELYCHSVVSFHLFQITKFQAASEIPARFIERNVSLRGKVHSIAEKGLEVEHVPIYLPVLSPLLSKHKGKVGYPLSEIMEPCTLSRKTHTQKKRWKFVYKNKSLGMWKIWIVQSAHQMCSSNTYCFAYQFNSMIIYCRCTFFILLYPKCHCDIFTL